MYPDIIGERPSRQIVPQLPNLRSNDAVADLLRVEIHHQPGQGTSECCLPNYLVSVHLGQPIHLQQTVEGHHNSLMQVAGDIMVFPPHLLHTFAWDVDAHFLLLRLEPTLFSNAARELADEEQTQIAPQLNLRDPLIRQIGLALKAETEVNGLSSRLYAESMANALAVHLLHHFSNQKLAVKIYADGLSNQKLQEAIEYIHEHLVADISIEAIAAQVGMSRFYFSRLFKQSTGFSPYQYLLRRRVERAQQLLTQKHMSITDIALDCGFSDSSQLARHFRKIVGVSPNVYRQQR
jgi:AraC family transcriptional regulator